MNISALESMSDATINAAIAAKILKCDAQDIRDQAHSAPQYLGFPVIVHGHRVKIPRIPFIQFIKGQARPDREKEGNTCVNSSAPSPVLVCRPLATST